MMTNKLAPHDDDDTQMIRNYAAVRSLVLLRQPACYLVAKLL